MDSTNKVICPQCGAQGTAGRFCEYCGTKIPMPETNIKKNDEIGADDFSWFTVCPLGWEPSTKDVIGDFSKSQYMVVVKRTTYQHIESEMVYDHGDEMENFINEALGKYVPKHQEIKSKTENVSTYCIINRHGKFVIGTSKKYIQLYADNSDYIVGGKLSNINSNLSVNLGHGVRMALERYILYYEMENGLEYYGIFDRENRTNINLNDKISTQFVLQKSLSGKDKLILKRKNNITKQEKTCSVTINGDVGVVTFKEDNEVSFNAEEYKKAFVEKKRIVDSIPFENVIIYKRNGSYSSYSIYDIENECDIALSGHISHDFVFTERLDSNIFIFKQNNNETIKTCTVEIKGHNGIVTFNETESSSHNVQKIIQKVAKVLFFSSVLVVIIAFIIIERPFSKGSQSYSEENVKKENVAAVKLNMEYVPSGTITIFKNDFHLLELGFEYYDSLPESKDRQINSFKITKEPISETDWKKVIDLAETPSGNTYGLKRAEDILKFIEKLNASTGLNYELPTEMQLRYAYSRRAISFNGEILCTGYGKEKDMYECIDTEASEPKDSYVSLMEMPSVGNTPSYLTRTSFSKYSSCDFFLIIN